MISEFFSETVGWLGLGKDCSLSSEAQLQAPTISAIYRRKCPTAACWDILFWPCRGRRENEVDLRKKRVSGSKMELFEARDHFIIQNGEYALWANRFDGSLSARTGKNWKLLRLAFLFLWIILPVQSEVVNYGRELCLVVQHYRQCFFSPALLNSSWFVSGIFV